VIAILENNPHGIDYKVFIATIPLITICPLINAVGSIEDRDEIIVKEWIVDPDNPAPIGRNEVREAIEIKCSYAKYYPHFLFTEYFEESIKHLNQNEVVHIDNYIRQYNGIIQEIIAEANAKIKAKRFYIVDIATKFSEMAFKRNNADPSYQFSAFFDTIARKVDTRYYKTTKEKKVTEGGLFSLDGVHPSAMGQGIIAYEFLKVMKKAGAYLGDPEKDIDWDLIYKNDDLLQNPIGLMHEIYDNIKIKKWLYKKLLF
jgi:hypothetical protein